MEEVCSLCGCLVHRSGEYGTTSIEGRSHASEHHFVAERFFGRSKNCPEKTRLKVFNYNVFNLEGEKCVYCYECHEVLLHNIIITRDDISRLAKLVRDEGLSEEIKSEDVSRLAGRALLLQYVFSRGLTVTINDKTIQHQIILSKTKDGI